MSVTSAFFYGLRCRVSLVNNPDPARFVIELTNWRNVSELGVFSAPNRSLRSLRDPFNQRYKWIRWVSAKIKPAIAEKKALSQVHKLALLAVERLLYHRNILSMNRVVIVNPGRNEVLRVISDESPYLRNQTLVVWHEDRPKSRKSVSVMVDPFAKLLLGIGVKENEPFKVLIRLASN